MKNLVTIIVLVFTFTAQAQKSEGQHSAEKILNKMTEELNLTETQQSKIKPLLEAQIADRKAMSEKRKAAKESEQKPSKEERRQLRQDMMDKATAMNTKIESILTTEQLVKFEISAKERKENRKKKKQ